MEKRFTQIIALLVMFFSSFVLSAQTMDPAYGIMIDESFEKGIPADWTQENVSGSVLWVSETQNLTYPTGAADSLARIAFRNTSGVTNKAVTRLVLPVVDISALFQPILVFSHAQDKWSGDFDSLRVLCRTSANGEWNTLTMYTDYISKWQRDTVFLPAQSYVQIAFEAVDNLGRGVVLDDVIIRSTPSCFMPEDLYTSGVTNNSITVNWMGSFDAEYFYVKLSKTPLTEAELESSSIELVCDTTTEGVSMFFDNLSQGAKYYCYVRSQCEHEISGWASLEFKTANIFNIPDTVDFNIPNDASKKGEYAFMDGWYYSAAQDDYKPYVNAYGTDWKYGGSYDGTSCLVFTYYVSSNKPTPQCYMGALPAGTWAYVATPEINADVKDLQISFETFVYYRYIADQFGIIVGVMTDPEDRSTFVPVKTIINDRPFIYEEYTVSFENYTGDGKYIAFMSDFDKTNHFTIEDLIIEPRKEVSTLQFDIMMPTASTMKFDFDQIYDSYEVVLSEIAWSSKEFDRNTDYPDSLAYVSKHTIVNMGTIEDLTPDARYHVYVRGIKGDKKGKWSYPRYVEMPSRFDVNTFPHSIDFENMETQTVDRNGYSASSATTPKIIKPLFTYPSKTFKLSDTTEWAASNYRAAEPLSKTNFEIGCYWPYHATTIAVFPETDMSTTNVSFYAVGRMYGKSFDPASASNQKNYKSKAAIGVMTDANDINSFIAIDTIEPSFTEYTYYEYDFSLYPEAKGNFFAIKVEEFEYTHTSVTSYTNLIHVDNMKFSKSLDCKSPTGMDVIVDENDPSKATITWNANGTTEWNVKIATTEYDKAQFGVVDTLEFVFDAKVSAPKLELTGLDYPNQTYYYWLQPVCGGVAAEWTIAYSFETFCPALFTVPYVQDFEGVETGSNVWTGFAAECLFTKQWTRNISGATPSGHYKNKYYYPYVTNTYAYSGENSLPIFRKYNSTNRNYIALPEFDKPIDSLQVTFRLYSLKTSIAYWPSQEIAIGVMTDPMDINTFEQVATVKPTKATTWERIIVRFDEYAGQGKYIAIRESDKYTSAPTYSSKYAGGQNTDSVYIDHIEVNIAPPCEIPYDIYASDVTPNSAQVQWKSDASSFIVVVTDKAFTFSDLNELDDWKSGSLASFSQAASVLSVDTVVGSKKLKLSELTIDKDYYVYIKASCLGMYTDYSDGYLFSTYCPTMSAETFYGDFSDGTSGNVPDCWFAGKTSGAYTGSNTIASYVSITSGAFTGQGKYVKLASTDGKIQSSTNQPNVNGTYLVIPSLDIDRIQDYKVKFKAFTSQTYCFSGCGANDYARSVIVGVVTNPYDMSTFVPVETIENIHYSPYPYEVYFDKYVCDLNGDSGKFVAFYSNFAIRNQIYLDDIELELIDDCPRFVGSVESTTPSSVTIKFDSVPTAYEVKVAKSVLSDFGVFEDDSLNLYPSTIGTSDVITIEGLKNHTEYYFYARSTVDTACTDWKFVLSSYPADSIEKSLPFYDGFESNVNTASYGMTPHDWYGYYLPGDKSYPTISSTAATGTRGVTMTANNKSVYLVSPKMKVDDLSACYLEYKLYTSLPSVYPDQIMALTIGVVSDPNNIESTFEPVDTLIITPEMRGSWFSDRVELTNYKGAGRHVAFFIDSKYCKQLYSAYNYISLQFDDIVIDYIPACYAPNSFKLGNVNDRSIGISFNHDGAIGYEALSGIKGFSVDSLGTGGSYEKTMLMRVKPFTGTEVIVDSLYSTMKYDVYVRAICSEKDTSNWVFAATAETLPSLISSYPYFNDFEDDIENADWKYRLNGQRGWYIGVDNDSLVADKKNSTDKALYVSSDGGATVKHNNKSGGTMAYRYIEFDKGTYNISFDWVVPGKPTLTSSQALFYQNLVRVLLVPSSVTITSYTGFKTADGRSISFSYIDPITTNLPAGWIELSDVHTWGKEYGALFGTDLSLPLENQWQRKSYSFSITEDNAGAYYLLFFFTGGTKAVDSEGYRTAAIDNLKIIKSECASITNLKVDSFIHNSATMSWNSTDPSCTSYDIIVLNENVEPGNATEAQKVYVGTATATTTTITGLQPFSTYYVYVRSTCDSEYNLWSTQLQFTTDVSVPEGYTFSFEEEEMLYYPPYVNSYMYEMNGDISYNNTTIMSHKWTTTSLIPENNTLPGSYRYDKTYALYYPQIAYDTLNNGNKYKFARTGEHSLWLGTRGGTSPVAFMNGATVTMPYAGDFDGKRLIFYMRGFAHYEASATVSYITTMTPNAFGYSLALDNQSRKVTVGTMTDPNDASTFVPLDTVEYPYRNSDYSSSTNLKKKDPSGDNGWHRAVISLKDAKGKYIAFRYEHYGTSTIEKSLNMYIDDVTIEPIPECPAPELLEITSLNESSAEINYFYEGVPTSDVLVATDENFTNIVLRDTFNTLPFTVTGLKPLTTYYLKANVICSDLDVSSYSRVLNFKTPKGICYEANFDEEATHYPEHWEHSFNPSFNSYIKGTGIFSFDVPSVSYTWGWRVKPAIFANGKFSSKHLVATATASSATSQMWASTPMIKLDETADQHLSFDLALTEKGTSNAVDFSNMMQDTTMMFAVIVVDVDEGYTIYKRENTVLWKSSLSIVDHEYDFMEIPHRGAEYSIDLNKYKGKNIQIFFYYGCSQSIELHLDNVHINKYVTKEYQQTVCEFCDFEDKDFFILSDNTEVGENKFSKWLLGEEQDTMLVLNLNVTDVPVTDVNATICEGDVYNDKGFTGLMNEGVYRQKFVSSNGCDSIVSLNLNVVKPQLTTIIDTICFGNTYTFAGQELNRTGIYVDTLVSVLTGCDSIVTLALSVADVIRAEQYVNICFGDTYTFGSQTISATGKYEELFKTVDGCDSLVTLHATMLPEYKQTINAVIKEGEEYNANGFVGLTQEGEYTLPLKSVDGCDSTVTLVLKVLSDESKQVSVNICFGDTYTFGTQTITQSGEYVEVFKAADGGDSTVILTAIVLPDLRQTIDAIICEGEVYNENGFENLTETGVFTLPLKSVDGCDSTITLNLTVLSGDTTRVDAKVKTDELPYEYRDLYYDKSTRPGTYVDTIIVETENCEEVIIHTLVVEAGTAVDNVSSHDLVMVPNPLAINGTLYINAEFTTEERDGMKLEVFNAIGQCVYSELPSIYPIEITGLAERGMYIVRIVTGDGKVYSDKIIVE